MMARPGRTAAVVGAVVAVSATTLMGVLAGTASAVAPGRCTENVNVRAEPSTTSRIVALCEAGTAVETGTTRDGFVQITDLGGWAAQEYISVDGAAPATGSPRSSATPGSTETTSPRTTSPAPSRSPESRSSTSRTPESRSAEPTTASRSTGSAEPSASSEPRSSSAGRNLDGDDADDTGSSAGAPAQDTDGDTTGGGSPIGGLLG